MADVTIFRPAPGCSRWVILKLAKASYDTVRSRLGGTGGSFKLHQTISANTTTTVYVLATNGNMVTKSGRPVPSPRM